MRVMTVVGTRPEIIRLSRVMAALDRHVEHVIVHTGQNYDYELNEIFFDDLQLRKPDHFLGAAGKTAAETVGLVIGRVDEVMAAVNPDALLVLGDTNSCLAAYPAKRRKIPVFHMEAGNRCFDERGPEEINRKIIDHIADVNLPYSTLARENLMREGLPPDRTIRTGSPMREVLAYYAPGIAGSSAAEELRLEPGAFFLVSAHREENVDVPSQLSKFCEVINGLGERYKQRVIVSTHPRTRKRLATAGLSLRPEVELLKPLGFFDYVSLQRQARLVLSDSGTITEESSILGFPALNVRDTHERPEGMEEAAVMMTGLEPHRIFECFEVMEAQCAAKASWRIVQDYDVPNVSEKVVRIIMSYTDYVNRKVWKR